MEPITRPTIEKLANDVGLLLRNGTYTVYDAIRHTFQKVNDIVDWLTDTADTLADNEDERIAAETARAKAETAREEAEQARVERDAAMAATYATKEYVYNAYCGVSVIERQDACIVLHFDTLTGDDMDEVEIPSATTDKAGLMSAADKEKLVELDTSLADKAEADHTHNGLVSAIGTAQSGADDVKLSFTISGGAKTITMPRAAMTAAGIINNVEWLALRALMRDTTMADYLTKRTTGWSVTLERGEALSVAIPTLQTGEKLYVKVNTSGERYNAIVLETSGSAASFTASAYCSVSGEWQEVTGLEASGLSLAVIARFAASEEAYSEAVEHDALDTLEQKQTNIELQFLIAE